MPSPRTAPAPVVSGGAVFLSYASQDAAAARRICEALRAAGVEVWFDQSELVGGDSWDRKIRGQIGSCALFVPVISAATQARHEGYFRLEWKLAAQRTHMMSGAKAFLLPVVIDATRDTEAHVPEEFRAVQWTRLLDDETPEKLCARVQALLGGSALEPGLPRPRERDEGATSPATRTPVGRRVPAAAWIGGIIMAAAILAFVVPRPKPDVRAGTRPLTTEKAPPTQPAPAAANQKSLVVLPFANQSADKDSNEFLSDGIADELLTTLQKIPGLSVAARTSAWSFKGRNPTAQEVGEKLGKAYVVDGSVQKSGNRVKITARLSRAATNEEVWSKSFGPLELTDLFTMQSDLAQAIVGELRGRLTGGATDMAAKAEIEAQVQAAEKGGTKNPEALQLYLQGRFFAARFAASDMARAVEFYEKALAADPSFARAWSALARARAWQGSWEPLHGDRFGEAKMAAERALTLVPELADAHAVMSQVMQRHVMDYRKARESIDRAVALAPDDPGVLLDLCTFNQIYGNLEKAIAVGRQAIASDPLNGEPRIFVAVTLYFAGRHAEALAEVRRAIELQPGMAYAHLLACQILLAEGRGDEALAEAKKEPERMHRLEALAAAEFALGHRREADELIKTFEKEFADGCPYQIAEVRAFRNEPDQAIKWLEHAAVIRDAGVNWLRIAPMLKSVREDPRYPALLRKLGLADEQLK